MKRSCLMMIVSAILFPSLGCMTTPINNSYTGRAPRFEGFELDPGREVTIQAWNVHEGEWQSIATAISRESYSWEIPIVDPESGLEFYRWETRRTYVPPQFWQARPSGDYLLSCKIRAIRDDGNPVKTYNSSPNWSGDGALTDYGVSGNPEDEITIWSF